MRLGLGRNARLSVPCLLLALALFLSAVDALAATTFDVTVSKPSPSFNYTFSPSSVSILKGDTVRWCWANSNCSGSTLEQHSTTSGSWDSGDKRSGSLSRTFNAAGAFSYFCDLHQVLGMEGSVTVAAFGSATHLALTPSPASPTAGDNFTLTVRALDRNNNIVGDFNGTVTLSNPTGSAASFSPNPVSITNGVGTATANLHSSGNQTIHATNGAISGDASVTVITAGATHFVISASVSPVQHRNFNFTVSVRDQFENVAAGYAGVVQVSSASDPTAVFTPTSAQLANGSGAFAVTFDAVGMQDITASDGLLSGTIAVNVIRDCDYLDETFPRLATANGITMTSGDFGLHSSVPNPSQITVSGMSGRVVGKVTVGINGFNEAHSSNAGFLLVGPGGQALILMSGVGGTGAASNVNLRFDDTA